MNKPRREIEYVERKTDEPKDECKKDEERNRSIKCNMIVGAPWENVFKIGIERYAGDNDQDRCWWLDGEEQLERERWAVTLSVKEWNGSRWWVEDF